MSDDGEFKKKLTNAEELLRQVDGETTQEAIDKWWKLNGLDAEEGRKKRQEAYIQQLKETAVTMASWRKNNENPTPDQN